jgi:hypothetical protein
MTIDRCEQEHTHTTEAGNAGKENERCLASR